MALGKIGSGTGLPPFNTANAGNFSENKKTSYNASGSSLSTYVPYGLNEGLTKVKPEQPVEPAQPAQAPAKSQDPTTPPAKKGVIATIFSPITNLFKWIFGSTKKPEEVKAAEEKKAVEQKKEEEKKEDVKSESKLRKKEKKHVAKEVAKAYIKLEKLDTSKKNVAQKHDDIMASLSPAAKEYIKGDEKTARARFDIAIEKDAARKAIDKKLYKKLPADLLHKFKASANSGRRGGIGGGTL